MQIAAHIERRGGTTFLAKRDLKGGQRFKSEILKCLEGCACVVVLVTHSVTTSQWVPYEIARAEGFGKPIVAIVQGANVEPPFPWLSELHSYDINDLDDYLTTIGPVL